MITLTPPIFLIDRFPHLQREIRMLAEQDQEFRQLSNDYELLIQSLRDKNLQGAGDREELISLKTSLEFEALEILSQIR
jgi:hypothetical protein